MASSPFFQLPRELRDRIYELIGGKDIKFNIVLDTDGKRLPVWARTLVEASLFGAPSTNPLLVSKQFKEEYETELGRHSTLRIGLPKTSFLPKLLLDDDAQVHRYLRHVSSLELRLWTLPEDHVEVYRDCILHFLPNLKTIMNDLLFRIDDVPSQELIEPAFGPNDIFILPFEDKTAAFITRVHLSADFFSINKDLPPTPAKLQRYPFLSRHEEWSMTLAELDDGNRVVYQVKPTAEDEHGGYDLVVLDEYTTELKDSMEESVRAVKDLQEYIAKVEMGNE